MSFPFDPLQGLIVVSAEIWGSTGSAVVRLALDTGATGTLVSAELVASIGYDSEHALERLEVTTGSGVEQIARLPLLRIAALGVERETFPILSHTLPASAGVDGVLGLDFLRGHVLTLDFVRGVGTLA